MSYQTAHDLSPTLSTALEQSQAGVLAQFIENWFARRAVRKMLAMDEHLLKDAGLTIGDVHWASHLPLSVNAALALEHRARRPRF
jgi:uncharacterized protein YjiS (DUF1127 family)